LPDKQGSSTISFISTHDPLVGPPHTPSEVLGQH